MGTQQILRTARAVIVAIACVNFAAAAPVPRRERVAIIDLTARVTPSSAADHADPVGSEAAVRARLSRALIAAGLEPIVGDGVEHALAGIAADRDSSALESSLAEAEQSDGQIQCAEVTAAARRALRLLAARQASGMAVPELPRVWNALLVCADRTGDIDGAMRAAEGFRVSSAATQSTVAPRDVLAKYPSVDTLLGMDRFDVDVATEDGAVVWVDFQPVGTAPMRLSLPAGDHIVAAARGARRGSATFTAEPGSTVTIELADQRSQWAAVASKIATWRGKLVAPHDLGWVLDQVDARVAVVRRGDTVQAWGRAGALEKPRQLAGAAGERTIAEADLIANVVAQAVHNFSARSPDPNRPLLVDSGARTRRDRGGDEPTAWWVYAAIGASIAAGALVIYLYRADGTPTPVELRRP